MKKIWKYFVIVLFISPVIVLAEEVGQSEIPEAKTEIVTLSKCVDGDTAHFKDQEGREFTARFLAVDTPESVHPTKEVEPFGKEASEYTCTTLTNATEIRLEYDSNSDTEDLYGRRLVWVFVDDILLQKSLVELGYAEVTYLYGDYKYTPLLQDTEAIAKAHKVGIWSDALDSSVDEKEQITVEDTSTKKKGFFDKLLDRLLATIMNFIDDLLEKLLKMIEDML